MNHFSTAFGRFGKSCFLAALIAAPTAAISPIVSAHDEDRPLFFVVSDSKTETYGMAVFTTFHDCTFFLQTKIKRYPGLWESHECRMASPEEVSRVYKLAGWK